MRNRATRRHSRHYLLEPVGYIIRHMVMRLAMLVSLAAVTLPSGCGGGDASIAASAESSSERAKAAVRPAGEVRMLALGTGTLRADPDTGCLWLETEAGKPTRQLLLQGESYRVDFSTSPASIRDGETVVARVGERVEVGGGFTERVRGVEGCPVTAGTFLGYF
jgi:hypothetical protein